MSDIQKVLEAMEKGAEEGANLFIKEAQKVGRVMIQEYKYLVERLEDDNVNVFIPAVGVPQSFDCFESLQFKSLLRNFKTRIYLIYDDLRIKRRWIEHLDWLNKSLEVQTIKKSSQIDCLSARSFSSLAISRWRL